MPEKHKKRSERRIKRVHGTKTLLLRRALAAAHIPYAIKDAPLPSRCAVNLNRETSHGRAQCQLNVMLEDAGASERKAVLQIYVAHYRHSKEEGKVSLNDIHPGYDVKPVSFDAKLKQVVLSVREVVDEYSYTERQVVLDNNEVKTQEKKCSEELGGAMSWYLVGFEDGQLFVRELENGVTSVKHANTMLTPVSLRNKPKSAYKKQGEMYFVPASPKQVHQLARVPLTTLSSSMYLPTLKPTIITNVVVNEHKLAQTRELSDNRRFATGTVSHRSHPPRTLNHWYQVLTSPASPAAVAKKSNQQGYDWYSW